MILWAGTAFRNVAIQRRKPSKRIPRTMSGIFSVTQKIRYRSRRIHFALELEALRLLPLTWVAGWLRLRIRLRFIRRDLRERINGGMHRPIKEHPETRRQKIQRHTSKELSRYLGFLLMTRDAAKYHSFLDIEGWERVDAELEKGKGVVLLTSHVGFTRLLRWYLRSRDYPVCHIYTMDVPKVATSFNERFQLRMRKRHHIDEDGLVGNEDSSVQFMKRAYECLRQNGVVNISGDGHVGERRIAVPMFNGRVSFPTGGISLALMSGATILPCFSDVDTQPKFRIQIQEPLTCPDGLSRSDQVQSLAESYATRIEEYVVRYPANVFQANYLRLLFSRGERSRSKAA